MGSISEQYNTSSNNVEWFLIGGFVAYYLRKIQAHLTTRQMVSTLEHSPESARAESIQNIFKRILETESKEGAEYSQTIQKMLDLLPNGVSQTIDTLKNQLKVVESAIFLAPASGLANPAEAQLKESKIEWIQKSYIALNSQAFYIEEDEIPFVLAHELGHIMSYKKQNLIGKYNLNFQLNYFPLITAISFIIPPLFFKFGLWQTLATTILMESIASCVYRHIEERKADNFAIKHCTDEELKGGIKFFKAFKKFESRLAFLLYPSIDSRIKKIEDALQARRSNAVAVN